MSLQPWSRYAPRSERFVRDVDLFDSTERITPASGPAQLLAHGKYHARAGRIASAFEALEKALAAAERKHDAHVCAGALDWLAWLAWIELDGPRTSIYARRMLTLELPTTSLEAFRLHIRRATQTLQLGDARLALTVLEKAEHAGRDADLDSFTAYLSVKADVFAALGQTSSALSHGRLATDIAEKRSDRYQQWRRLEYFGYIQYASGMLTHSMTTYLHAEAVARNAGLTWEVPFSRVRAAWIAFLLGDLRQAHALIASCFDFGPSVQWMIVTRAWVGLTIGLAVVDERLVEQCSDAAHLMTALESGDSYTLARTAAAFHEYYVQHGDLGRAAQLLDVAVPALTSPDCALPLFEPIARYGDSKLREHGSALLAAFPDAHVLARAQRLLFAAVSARRDGDVRTAERLSGEAQFAFEECEHHYHAARCMELGGRRSESHVRFMRFGALRDARRTAGAPVRRGRPRESYEIERQRREVLALLLAGATTKSIADRLGLSIRTIKHRIAEILRDQDATSCAELRMRAADPRLRRHPESREGLIGEP